MTRQLDVAVAIVSFETAPLLERCLRSLHEGGLDGLAAGVWVFDNASQDGSVAVVQREFPDVHLLMSDRNLGYAAANNQLLRDAGFAAGGSALARHALLLNPDTVVPPGAIAELVAFLEAEPDIGVVGPKLVRADGSLDLACRRSFPTPAVSLYRFAGLSRLFPGSRRFGRYNLTYLDPDLPVDVDAVVGACMLVRGTAIEQVGLLDERFWMYGEDLDWAFRIRQAGWRVVYRPQVTIQHVKRAAAARSSRASYEFTRAMWLFYQKHYARTTSRPIHWLIVLALALRGGRRLIAEMRAARSGP